RAIRLGGAEDAFRGTVAAGGSRGGCAGLSADILRKRREQDDALIVLDVEGVFGRADGGAAHFLYPERAREAVADAEHTQREDARGEKLFDAAVFLRAAPRTMGA